MFKIDFVGVVCLVNRDDSVIALIPDGRRAKPKHVARIVVDPESVRDGADTWGTREEDDIEGGEFLLPPGPITLEGADVRGKLNTGNLATKLPRLSELAREFDVDPESRNVWSSVTIRQGELMAFRWPGSRDSSTVSILTQLTVPHEGEFRISVGDRRRADRQPFLQLAAGTNVVIVNDSEAPTSRNPHFHIYNLLDRQGRELLSKYPPSTPPGLDPLRTTHHFYSRGVSGDDLCPNTGG